MREEYWMVAVKFEYPVAPDPSYSMQLFRSITFRRAGRTVIEAWEVQNHETREKADVAVGILREMFQTECTCGRCPIIRDVQLVHIKGIPVDIGLPAVEKTDIPADLKRMLGFDS